MGKREACTASQTQTEYVTHLVRFLGICLESWNLLHLPKVRDLLFSSLFTPGWIREGEHIWVRKRRRRRRRGQRLTPLILLLLLFCGGGEEFFGEVTWWWRETLPSSSSFFHFQFGETRGATNGLRNKKEEEEGGENKLILHEPNRFLDFLDIFSITKLSTYAIWTPNRLSRRHFSSRSSQIRPLFCSCLFGPGGTFLFPEIRPINLSSLFGKTGATSKDEDTARL